jgi:hypothetical protein
MIPSKSPYSSGWSSVWAAKRFSFGSRGPLGIAKPHQDAVDLDPEVPVHVPRGVLLDHECARRAGRERAGLGLGAERLRRGIRVALLPVASEVSHPQ